MVHLEKFKDGDQRLRHLTEDNTELFEIPAGSPLKFTASGVRALYFHLNVCSDDEIMKVVLQTDQTDPENLKEELARLFTHANEETLISIEVGGTPRTSRCYNYFRYIQPYQHLGRMTEAWAESNVLLYSFVPYPRREEETASEDYIVMHPQTYEIKVNRAGVGDVLNGATIVVQMSREHTAWRKETRRRDNAARTIQDWWMGIVLDSNHPVGRRRLNRAYDFYIEGCASGCTAADALSVGTS